MGGGLGATSLGCNIMQVFFLSIFTSYSKLLLLASFSLDFLRVQQIPLQLKIVFMTLC